jgi:hypothetical protein
MKKELIRKSPVTILHRAATAMNPKMRTLKMCTILERDGAYQLIEKHLLNLPYVRFKLTSSSCCFVGATTTGRYRKDAKPVSIFTV